MLATTAVLAAAGLGFAQHNETRVASATQSARAEARLPDVMVIAFHADWCPGCQALGPKLMKEVIPSLTDEPSLFVKLDQTDRNSRQAEYMLASLGLGHLWAEYGGKTGFALVVDTETRQVVDKLTHKQASSQMSQVVKAAISG